MSASQEPASDSSPSRFRRGPVLMALATLTFTIMLGFVKVARVELDASEIVFWRSFVGLPLAALGLIGVPLLPKAPVLLLARTCLGFLAMICFFTAAKGLPLADHSLITKLQPLLLAIVAPMALGASEKPDRRIWSALLLGLAGCAMLLAPELQASWLAGAGYWGLWAVGSAVFSAGAHTCLRALGRSDHPGVIVFWFQLGIIPLAFALATVSQGAWPTVPGVHLWPYLAAIGACAVLGQWLMTRAYRADRAAIVAAASYTAPLWAVLGDLIWWQLSPSWTTIIGGSVIVLAGLLVALRR